MVWLCETNIHTCMLRHTHICTYRHTYVRTYVHTHKVVADQWSDWPAHSKPELLPNCSCGDLVQRAAWFSGGGWRDRAGTVRGGDCSTTERYSSHVSSTNIQGNGQSLGSTYLRISASINHPLQSELTSLGPPNACFWDRRSSHVIVHLFPW